jgi:hypothetical protein
VEKPMRKRMTPPLILRGLLCAALSAGCAAESGTESEDDAERYYPTSSVVFGEDGQSTYMSLLRSLDSQELDLDEAREFAGWADLWVHEDRLFVTDGEGPALTRYSVGETGELFERGRLSFLSYGAESAAFWRNVVVDSTKAYLFVPGAREVVVWDPAALGITGSFALPELADRGSQLLYVTTDRGSVLRDGLLYVAASWGDWDDYSLTTPSSWSSTPRRIRSSTRSPSPVPT